MRIPKHIPQELKRLINFIVKRLGDCETLLDGYNHNPWGYTWYGHKMICEPLFCCYGRIGYSISYQGYELHVDNDMDRITIEEY